MAQNPGGALFCDNIGFSSDGLRCCYANDQDSQACRTVFSPDGMNFTTGCPGGDCIKDCAAGENIYQSLLQNEAYEGDNSGPLTRFRTCANVPSMTGFLGQGLVSDRINSTIADVVPVEASSGDLKMVTNAVTECLTSTCQNARHPATCQEPCLAVNLLINNTMPNVEGINACLYSLCSGSYNSLPYADADVVGIGVFASYIMQCALVVLLLFGLTGFEFHSHWRRKHPKTSQHGEQQAESAALTDETKPALQPETENKATHREIFEDVLVQYHQAQCYFSGTLQIASLSYGIFGTDMLITFMLTPLATNGVLPVIFAYILLIRCGKARLDITLLTLVCWLLSTIVYWSLYSSIIPINSKIRSEKQRYRAYQQFMYKLSAIDACGGYSALAVCPQNFELARLDISRASHRLRVLTPIIWTFATLSLLGALAIQFRYRLRQRRRERDRARQREVEKKSVENSTDKGKPLETESTPLAGPRMSVVYYVVVLCFLAGVGMQLSLLSIGTSLKMMDRKDWGFGQIVAVTIWAPAALEYAYKEARKISAWRKKDRCTRAVQYRDLADDGVLNAARLSA